MGYHRYIGIDHVVVYPTMVKAFCYIPPFYIMIYHHNQSPGGPVTSSRVAGALPLSMGVRWGATSARNTGRHVLVAVVVISIYYIIYGIFNIT